MTMDEKIPDVIQSVSKPLEKLIDSISKATGVLYEPTHLVRMAKAGAKANVIAEKNRLEITELQNKAEKRVRHIELQRQVNIDAIVQIVMSKLASGDSSFNINNEWLTQYFESCKDVENEQMRALWAEVLAGESKNPGSYSLKTLGFIKSLSPSDAILFSEIAKYVMSIEGIPCLLWNYRAKRYYNENGFSISDLHSLRQSGFLTIQEDYRLYRKKKIGHLLSYSSHEVKIDTAHHGESTIPILLLSHEATDLLALTTSAYDENYFEVILNSLKVKKRIVIYVDDERFHAHDPGNKYFSTDEE